MPISNVRARLAAIIVVLAGCAPEEPPPTIPTAPVTRRDIIVAVEASGLVEPLLTVELKSKASGEILEVRGETGDLVPAGTLLVQVDKRTPRNMLSQSESELEAARARRTIAESQMNRAKKLLAEKLITEVDYDKTVLDFANAKADVVRAQVAMENARISLDDTDLRAPITGTIIERLVSPGQVISSPMKDFGGGTLLLKMADLSSVQVRTRVDETDIGNIAPGQRTIVRVTAYPNQPFEGQVLKIEPQAFEEENVTTFAVLIRLDNKSGLLRPGMNADVEIRVAEQRNVLAVPTNALRTPKDIPTAAAFVGVSEAQVREQLGAGNAQPRAAPAGIDPARFALGGRYWVFVKRDGGPRAVNATSGVTDLDHSEVLDGLAEGDEVLLLPSSGLVQTQQRMQEQMRRFTGVPGMTR
jgi:HlyD family secretion protein